MKEYWITNSRFKYIALIMFLMWLVVIGFYYLKADEITKDPCTICSERYGETVVCSRGGTIPVYRTFYSNGTVADVGASIYTPQNESKFKLKLNFSE